MTQNEVQYCLVCGIELIPGVNQYKSCAKIKNNFCIACYKEHQRVRRLELKKSHPDLFENRRVRTNEKNREKYSKLSEEKRKSIYEARKEYQADRYQLRKRDRLDDIYNTYLESIGDESEVDEEEEVIEDE